MGWLNKSLSVWAVTPEWSFLIPFLINLEHGWWFLVIHHVVRTLIWKWSKWWVVERHHVWGENMDSQNLPKMVRLKVKEFDRNDDEEDVLRGNTGFGWTGASFGEPAILWGTLTMLIGSGRTTTILKMSILSKSDEVMVLRYSSQWEASERAVVGDLVVGGELLVVAPQQLHEEVEARRVALLLARLLGEAEHLLSHLRIVGGGWGRGRRWGRDRQRLGREEAEGEGREQAREEGRCEDVRIRAGRRMRGRKMWGCEDLADSLQLRHSQEQLPKLARHVRVVSHRVVLIQNSVKSLNLRRLSLASEMVVEGIEHMFWYTLIVFVLFLIENMTTVYDGRLIIVRMPPARHGRPSLGSLALGQLPSTPSRLMRWKWWWGRWWEWW